MARIKAANTINPETGYSPNQLLERRTTDYFGGPEVTKWSKDLAGQDQRGLMVETLKVEGTGMVRFSAFEANPTNKCQFGCINFGWVRYN